MCANKKCISYNQALQALQTNDMLDMKVDIKCLESTIQPVMSWLIINGHCIQCNKLIKQ